MNWVTVEGWVNKLNKDVHDHKIDTAHMVAEARAAQEKGDAMLEQKIRTLPQGMEFRIWCLALVALYFGTNPTAAGHLKLLLGL